METVLRKGKQPYFTEEHDALRERVRQFVKKEVSPYISEWEELGTFPVSMFRKMGSLGFLGLRYPESVGGQGGDYFMQMVLAEEINKCGAGGFPMGIAVQTDMATPPILQFGSPYHHEHFLKPAIRGEKIAAIGISEPNTGSDVSSIQTRAVKQGGEWVLNGAKMYITNGTRADFVTMVVRTSDEPGYKGISLFLVETDTPGYSVSRKLDKVGMRSSDTAELILDNVRVPDKNLLGVEGKGFYQIMWQLQGERMIAAASAIGIMDFCYEKAAEAVENRGPAYRRSLLDIKRRIEVCREMTYATAFRYSQGEVPSKEISMIKLLSAQTAHYAAGQALKLLGEEAAGPDHPVQRLWRDSRLNRIGAGTDEVMKEIIAKEIGL
ncbi:acyl-CoA dehydrogenase family protein [Alteribacter natronophilus]|uniref:acyl-CoA dehydrogenase family protein n=1 Tax=Alteribacter natronophilus TaxID=2583810 RepID=UPI00110EC4D9|nr:acyl-CoA dehydrogenase family protein [Alteribacter natronophilus]TMW71579.1 acyl-CoA dehydrogenase [Alteribacter natronophilus]